ncbi:glucose-1-phosphate cytidylyltransferase, partial [Escherichia coli]|nr:glucose-1-phosphate cytidylyltransferase [Escherichia coli]
GFVEKPKDDSGWINAGFMVMEPGIFNYLDKDSCVLERIPLEALSAEGKLGVYRHDGFWQCMDTQRDQHFLEDLWITGQAPWRLWND